MKSIRTGTLVVFAFLCAGLSACTDSSIREVKRSSLPQSDFTFGEALDDSAKGCKATEWTHRDDDNGRPMVEYICTTELSSTLVETARKENVDKLKSFTARLDQRWQGFVETIKQRQNSVAQAQLQARGEVDRSLNEVSTRLQVAQEQLKQALEKSPEQYVGPVRNGYTPTLLAEGERRKQTSVQQLQRQIEGIQKQRETFEKVRDAPTGVERQLAMTQYRSAAEYQRTLDGVLAWKDRYYAAMKEIEAKELKKAEDFLSVAKDRKLQMKVTFLVKNKSPVELRSASWIYDGKEDGAVNTAYLAAVLLDPKRMQEVVNDGWKSRLRPEISIFDLEMVFPIACDEKLIDGCELRKPAS